MKKILLGFGALAFSLLTVAPAATAEAHYRNNRASNFDQRERLCQRLEAAELRAWKYVDEYPRWGARFVQNRIDLQDRFDCAPDGTIVEQLTERSQFNTLAQALTEAGLVDTLNSEGDFTVFAPTDAAFAKLGQDTLQAVLADKDLLTNILTYHVVDPAQVPNSVPSDVAVTLDSAPMLNGQSVDIQVRNGHLFINDAKVIVKDVKATNGTVHVIDTVLIP